MKDEIGREEDGWRKSGTPQDGAYGLKGRISPFGIECLRFSRS